MADRTRCKDCHTAGSPPDALWRSSPRAECSKCHGLSSGSAGISRVQANCNSCHQQHGSSRDMASLIPPAGTSDKKLKDYFARLEATELTSDESALATNRTFYAAGEASWIRHDQDSLTSGRVSQFGALPMYGWLAIAGALPLAGVIIGIAGTIRRRRLLAAAVAKAPPPVQKVPTGSLDLEKLRAEGPPYPHPVIDPVLCIGCHACVEACPHDVLAIVNGISAPVALDQCMEDTGCQAECPTIPKACIVINTTRVIPPRKVPKRDRRFMTNVEGIYLIGDVSGVPLIKNAINEGAQVVDYVVEDLSRLGLRAGAQYDVAIIGIGPAGLSATAIAKQRGLKYIAIEQDKIVSTIENYPAGKYIFFKPETVDAKGVIPLPGVGEIKETILNSWVSTIRQHGLQLNEEECCTGIKPDGDIFMISTERGKAKEKMSYTARRVILGIGNRGTPMKLKVKGEELKILAQPSERRFSQCPKCQKPRRAGQAFCVWCGLKFEDLKQEPYMDDKVKFKLSDPDDYVSKKCIVVGAGNSAIEAAVDLCGLKRDGDRIEFIRDNDVTLVIRSDFKGDLKLGNKINVYDCIDAGRIKVFFRTEIKEIKEGEVTLMDVRSKEERAKIPNDYVFALIGGERPTKFLEGLGIKIG